jgi:hypothetical protein
LAYFEWGCESGADMRDRENWAAANPGLGYRLSRDFLEDELESLSEDGFAREHGGIWDDVASGIFAPGVWESLADPQAERGNAPVFAVATAPDRSWSAVAVAWKRPDGSSQVMLADYRPDAIWVADRCAELRRAWGGRVIAANKAAQGLMADAENLSEADQAKAHNALSDAVLAGTVHHGNEPAMNTAVRAARWKPSGNTRVLDQKGSTDISPLTAAAGAVNGVTTAPTSSGWMVGLP